MLDGVERVGNKIPHPAMLFLGLAVMVIVVSQILFWFNVKATYEVISPPPTAAHETYYGGGSTKPNYELPSEQQPATAYKPHEETTKVAGLLVGSALHFHLIRPELPGVLGGSR